MTHQQELNIIDYETALFAKRLRKHKFKHVVVSDVKVNINEPSPIKAKMWWQFWIK